MSDPATDLAERQAPNPRRLIRQAARARAAALGAPRGSRQRRALDRLAFRLLDEADRSLARAAPDRAAPDRAATPHAEEATRAR